MNTNRRSFIGGVAAAICGIFWPSRAKAERQSPWNEAPLAPYVNGYWLQWNGHNEDEVDRFEEENDFVQSFHVDDSGALVVWYSHSRKSENVYTPGCVLAFTNDSQKLMVERGDFLYAGNDGLPRVSHLYKYDLDSARLYSQNNGWPL